MDKDYNSGGGHVRQRFRARGPIGLLESTPMKRFYLASPSRYEDQVIEALGQLGTVQLITDYTVNGFKKVDTVEKCEKYVKLQQRMSSVLSTLPPQKGTKKGLALAEGKLWQANAEGS